MPKIEKTCVSCGKNFSVWPNRADTAKTCSQPCRGKYLAQLVEGYRPHKNCEICGAKFFYPPSFEGLRKCCSRKCAAILSKQRPCETGSSHFNWKGGKSAHSDGYLYMRTDNHPFASHGKYALEHRLIMEAWMRETAPTHKFLIDIDGVKYLRPEIEIHHINENKRDNRVKNLLACTASTHRLIHNGKAPMKGEVWPDVDGMVDYQPTRISCNCELCGKGFVVKRSVRAKGSGRFCSRDCYYKRPRNTFQATHKA
jgi:predicted nucleic acid-binding Zn ribbon protein